MALSSVMKVTNLVLLLSFLQNLLEVFGEKLCEFPDESKKQELRKALERCMQDFSQCKIGIPIKPVTATTSTEVGKTNTTSETKIVDSTTKPDNTVILIEEKNTIISTVTENSQEFFWFSPFPGSKYKYLIIELDESEKEKTSFIAYTSKCRDMGGDLAYRGIRNLTERIEILSHVRRGIEKLWIGLRKSNKAWRWTDHTVAEDEDIHWNNEFKNQDERHTCAFMWRNAGFSEDVKCHSRDPEAGLCEKPIDWK